MVILKFALENYDTEDEVIATMENPLFIPRIGELVSYGREPSKEELKAYGKAPFPYLFCDKVVNISYDYDKDITVIVWF